MQVIVLGGMGRVGKTDVADWIVDAAKEDGMNPVRLSFADPLKKQAAADAGYGDDWRKYKAEKPEDYRQVCQDLGASRRAEDPDYWVNLWKMQLASMAKEELEATIEDGIWEETVVVVDDCRYRLGGAIFAGVVGGHFTGDGLAFHQGAVVDQCFDIEGITSTNGEVGAVLPDIAHGHIV